MTGCSLAPLGDAWTDLLDGLADNQVELLKSTARRMAEAVDEDARFAIEGAFDWRDLSAQRGHHAN